MINLYLAFFVRSLSHSGNDAGDFGGLWVLFLLLIFAAYKDLAPARTLRESRIPINVNAKG